MVSDHLPGPTCRWGADPGQRAVAFATFRRRRDHVNSHPWRPGMGHSAVRTRAVRVVAAVLAATLLTGCAAAAPGTATGTPATSAGASGRGPSPAEEAAFNARARQVV